MRKLIAIAGIILISAGIVSAKGLKTYKAIYKKNMEKIILSHGMNMTDLRHQYTKTLDALLTQVKQTGDLDKTMATINEIKRFKKEKNMPNEASATPEIQNQQIFFAQKTSVYEAEKTKSIMSIVSKYDCALEGLQKKLVINDEIDEAQKVQKERKEILKAEAYISAQAFLKEKEKKTAVTVVKKIGCLRTTGDVLAAAIEQKAKFVVQFDKLSASIGTIRPGAALFGVYDKDTQSWEVWSSSHPGGPDYHYVYGYPGGGKVGSLRKAVRPSDNNINLWNVTFSFDEEGNVFYPLGTKQVVGHLQVPSKKGSANK